MAEVDEYDSHYTRIDIEDLPYIFDLPPSPVQSLVSATLQLHEARVPHIPEPASPTSVISDDFSTFDFNEFSAEDFDQIDAAAVAAFNTPCSPPAHGSVSTRVSLTALPKSASVVPLLTPLVNAFDGPEIQIEVEVDPLGKQEKVALPPGLAYYKSIPKWHRRQVKRGSSPYDRFRSWKGTLSVTDLVGPAWCEVQFDYGLRQGRARKVEDRPTSFVTSEGKTISVDKSVAVKNDRVIKAGQSVHTALEKEIPKEQVAVEVTTPEDRWGLRLINLMHSIQDLLFLGRSREIPVFGLLQGEVVVGIIDEIERRPIPSDSTIYREAQTQTKGKPKRGRGTSSVPDTPSKRRSKKTAPQSSSPTIPLAESSADGMDVDSPMSSHSQYQPYFSLHLSDTKTRYHPTVPSDKDAVPAYLQLMLYHRLLSDLLALPGSPAGALKFQQLWKKLKLSPTRHFSTVFSQQAGLDVMSSAVVGGVEIKCLDDLVEVWKIMVERLNLKEVSQTLTVVYRTQSGRPEITISRSNLGLVNNLDGLDIAMSKQEEEDLARAIEASLVDQLPVLRGEDSKLSSAINESIEGVATIQDSKGGSLYSSLEHPPQETERHSSSSTAENDEELLWAIHQSLLSHVRDGKTRNGAFAKGYPPSDTRALGESEGSDSDSGALEESKIIGKKTFQVDYAQMDEYVQNVLQWWHGKRPPKGVDVGLTRRCFSCEYQEGCEWREQKAEEARARIKSDKA